MGGLGVQGQQPKRGSPPEQVLGLYAKHHSLQLREEILELWREHRREYARHIEEAVARMAEEPASGFVPTDGKVIDQWDEAFARYPQLWLELERDIRQITNSTRANVDRLHYSRVVLATMSRWRSLRPLEGCARPDCRFRVTQNLSQGKEG